MEIYNPEPQNMTIYLFVHNIPSFLTFKSTLFEAHCWFVIYICFENSKANHRTETRFKKFRSDCKKLDYQVRSGRTKTMNFVAVRYILWVASRAYQVSSASHSPVWLVTITTLAKHPELPNCILREKNIAKFLTHPSIFPTHLRMIISKLILSHFHVVTLIMNVPLLGPGAVLYKIERVHSKVVLELSLLLLVQFFSSLKDFTEEEISLPLVQLKTV